MEKNWLQNSYMQDYADEIGGVFSYYDWEIIPFNHWKKDIEWIVLIVPSSLSGIFIPVEAISLQQAVEKAIKIYEKSLGEKADE